MYTEAMHARLHTCAMQMVLWGVLMCTASQTGCMEEWDVERQSKNGQAHVIRRQHRNLRAHRQPEIAALSAATSKAALWGVSLYLTTDTEALNCLL